MLCRAVLQFLCQEETSSLLKSDSKSNLILTNVETAFFLSTLTNEGSIYGQTATVWLFGELRLIDHPYVSFHCSKYMTDKSRTQIVYLPCDPDKKLPQIKNQKKIF